MGLMKHITNETTKQKIRDYYFLPHPFKNNNFTWRYFDRNYASMSCKQVQQYITTIFARVGGTDKLLLKKNKDEYNIISYTEYETLMRNKSVRVPVVAKDKKAKNTMRSTPLTSFTKQYCYEKLTYYEGYAVVSDDKEVFPTFRIPEPEVYMQEDCRYVHNWIKQHTAHEEDFWFETARDKWRFSNGYRRTNQSIGYFGNAGEGKSFSSQLRCKVYKGYNTPAMKLAALHKEQTRNLLENKLYLYVDEVEKSNQVDSTETEDYKRLWNSNYTTRGMGEGEIEIPILFDIDLTTNHKDFRGLFKEEAVARRMYPILRCHAPGLSKIEEEKGWDKCWKYIDDGTGKEDVNFVRSWVKFIRENFEEECKGYRPHTMYKQSKLYYEIKDMVCEDSAKIWFDYAKEHDLFNSLTTFTDKDGNLGFDKDELFKSYLSRCTEIKTKNYGITTFKQSKLEDLGFELAERRVKDRYEKQIKKKLAFISPDKVKPDCTDDETLDC
jgi:hypothetical protein